MPPRGNSRTDGASGAFEAAFRALVGGGRGARRGSLGGRRGRLGGDGAVIDLAEQRLTATVSPSWR
jgi:hypothetical protein